MKSNFNWNVQINLTSKGENSNNKLNFEIAHDHQFTTSSISHIEQTHRFSIISFKWIDLLFKLEAIILLRMYY